MLLLGLDTSSSACSVAVVDVSGDAGLDGRADGGTDADAPDAAGDRQRSRATATRVAATRAVVDGRRHAEILAALVAEALAEAAVTAGQLAAVAVGLGPGPFTGLRVGIVTAAALADALAIPVYGICSLDALAAADDAAGPLAAVGDARRREVYWARYGPPRRRLGPGVVLRERLEGPHVTAPAALAQLLPADHRLIGAGGELYRTSWEAAFDAQAGRYPSAVALAVLAGEQLAAGNPAGPLTPLYLRRPDATPPGAPKPVSTSDAAGPVDSPAGVR